MSPLLTYEYKVEGDIASSLITSLEVRYLLRIFSLIG